MISVKELTKQFGGLQAVAGVSFEVGTGEVTGFLGPNGAGKSTTLRMLSGFLAPTRGSALICGLDVVESSLDVRRRVGYLPENNPLYEEMDAAQYLEWTACVRGLKGSLRTARIRSAVECCGLGDVLAKTIGLLSKGYRQRVGLAAAILHDPEVLLLDEPTSGLDPNQSAQVRSLIGRLKAEKTVLLSTHILPEVEATCEKIIILHRGRIAATGNPGDLIRAANRAPLIRLALKRGRLGLDVVRKALEDLPGVRSAGLEPGGRELRVSLEAEEEAGDLRESVFRLAVKKKWVLLGLQREEATLEKVFRELTPDGEPADCAEGHL